MSTKQTEESEKKTVTLSTRITESKQNALKELAKTMVAGTPLKPPTPSELMDLALDELIAKYGKKKRKHP